MASASGRNYTRSYTTAERDAEIARYCVEHTITEAAAHFGLNKSTVSRARQRAIAAVIQPAGQEALAAELLELENLRLAAYQVLRAHHVHVADGRIVKDDGIPVTDHKPVLMAIDRVLRIAESRRKLLGSDAPTKQTIHVLTEDVVDAALREAAEEHARLTADPARSIT